MDLIELEEHSTKSAIYVNPSHISALIHSGIFTTVVLHCGKELRVSQNIHKIKDLGKNSKK